jgi:hypothetical protein
VTATLFERDIDLREESLFKGTGIVVDDTWLLEPGADFCLTNFFDDRTWTLHRRLLGLRLISQVDGVFLWTRGVIPRLPSSSDMFMSSTIWFSHDELASAPPYECDAMSRLMSFSLSKLDEQFDPQSATGLACNGFVNLAWGKPNSDVSGGVSAAFKRSSSARSLFEAVHKVSLKDSFISTCLSFLEVTRGCFATLHQSQIQLPESAPSIDVEQ